MWWWSPSWGWAFLFPNLRKSCSQGFNDAAPGGRFVCSCQQLTPRKVGRYFGGDESQEFLALVKDLRDAVQHNESMAERTRADFYQGPVGEHARPGCGPLTCRNALCGPAYRMLWGGMGNNVVDLSVWAPASLTTPKGWHDSSNESLHAVHNSEGVAWFQAGSCHSSGIGMVSGRIWRTGICLSQQHWGWGETIPYPIRISFFIIPYTLLLLASTFFSSCTCVVICESEVLDYQPTKQSMERQHWRALTW